MDPYGSGSSNVPRSRTLGKNGPTRDQVVRRITKDLHTRRVLEDLLCDSHLQVPFTNKKVQDLCWEKNIVLSYSPAHQPSSNGIAERMVGLLKTTVRRMLKRQL